MEQDNLGNKEYDFFVLHMIEEKSSVMQVTMTKGSVPMEIKKLSISAKRQITIPQKFFTMLGFDAEAEEIASSKSGYISYEDVFGTEEEE